jgi:hypothetical protein
MDLQQVTSFFELFSYIVTSIGLPFALYSYVVDLKKEEKRKEDEALSHSADRYVAFLELAINYPYLDVFSTPIQENYKLTPDQLRQEEALLALLIDMFEKAYLLYFDCRMSVKRNQWVGWERTILSYCFRSNFQREWENIGEQFDTDFYNYMNQLMVRHKSKELGCL